MSCVDTQVSEFACESAIRVRIELSGIVQGVGFRPFVYRIARRNSLTGFVSNNSTGVVIEVEGCDEDIEYFRAGLRCELPPHAFIEHWIEKNISAQFEHDFRICESTASIDHSALISPDLAMCEDCRRELRDPMDRRFQYPLTNCTNCGPRFTIIREVPYDRERTTMSGFALCPECEAEYRDPMNRRFHAEPIACPVCGPKVSYHSTDSVDFVTGQAAIIASIAALQSGKIVAVKGMGGYHLACDAFNEDAVKLLRARKQRPAKPLAVMFRDMDTIRAICHCSELESKEITSRRSPIVLLRMRDDVQHVSRNFAHAIAPHLNEIGAFLPYTPLHQLLFQESSLTALVMTSGNVSDEPIIIDDDIAVEKLSGLADGILAHNRPIWNRCDDSVGFVHQDRFVVTRRARGFAPRPITLMHPVQPTLAVGAMYANTFTLASGKRAFLSQHIGDVDNQEALSYLIESIHKYEKWLGILPEVIACDAHPDLLTTQLARELANQCELVTVQHHHAHLASAMAAHRIEESVIGIVCDGTGFGEDGTIWGGEIFVGDLSGFTRVGHLQTMPLPGGDAATKHPYRTALAYFHQAAPELDEQVAHILQIIDPLEQKMINRMVETNIGVTQTSSVGRLFDAVSALLGACSMITYEGQAAIELEQLSTGKFTSTSNLNSIQCAINEANSVIQLNPIPMLRGILECIIQKVPANQIGAAFHHAVAHAFSQACIQISHQHKIKSVVVCGGVFQNRLLLNHTHHLLANAGLHVHLPGEVPVNDGGISLGQVVLANRKILGRKL